MSHLLGKIIPRELVKSSKGIKEEVKIVLHRYEDVKQQNLDVFIINQSAEKDKESTFKTSINGLCQT